MVSLSTWCRYAARKVTYSITFSRKIYRVGKISDSEVLDVVYKSLFQGRLTYVQQCKEGVEGEGSVLVRKLPEASPMTVFVGDVVVLKDPEEPGTHIMRRLTAIEGYEIVSTDEKDEPFVLENDQCWVLCDNKALKPEQEARDSRTFGPISLQNIVGRVLYNLRTPVHHGPVKNSRAAMKDDEPVLAVELDVSEMARKFRR